MKKVLLLLVASIVFLQCNAETTTPKEDTIAPRILIINAFDASEMKARKNKMELFAELADSLKYYLHSELGQYSEFETIVAEELIGDTTRQIFNTLLQKYNCTSAIVISKLSVYFEQTNVDVTRDYDGSKTREASYDICSDVRYLYYINAASPEVFDKKKCSFFTKRNVASGILAAGPDVVGKSKYTFIAIRQNAAIGATDMIYFLKKENNQ
jgi:hypothetical protein